MLENQTADEVANLVRMNRSLYQGTIIVVEGTSDILIYKRLTNSNCCILLPANSKENAIHASEILNDDGCEGILTIIDSDFCKVDGQHIGSKNLLTTDTHDLESMIISSNALDKILAEYGEDDQINRLVKPIRQILVETAFPVGLLRWLSLPHKKNLGIDFKLIRFSEFIDRTTFSTNIDIMIEHVLSFPTPRRFDKIMLKNEIQILIKQSIDNWQICNGHDLVQILAFGLKEIFGNSIGRGISARRLDSILRIAYEDSHFHTTQLFSDMISWERDNSPYRIF